MRCFSFCGRPPTKIVSLRIAQAFVRQAIKKFNGKDDDAKKKDKSE